MEAQGGGIMRKFKLAKTEAGFGMMEVLVSLLVLMVFFLISGEGLLVSATFRVQAERKNKANLLIEEDINRVRYKASKIATPPDDQPDPKCSVETVTDNNNYGKDLIAQLGGQNTEETVTILHKQHTLKRNAKNPSGPKKNIVEIYYQVENDSTGKVIASNSTKVSVHASKCGEQN